MSMYPTGGTATLSTGVIASNILPVTVSNPTVAGQYYFDVTATLSDAEKSVGRLIVNVSWDSGVRSTMIPLINELRGMVDAGVNDYTIGGQRYWSDAQIQAIMDARRTDYKYLPLDSVPDYVNGTVSIHDYQIPFRWYETGGTTLQVLNYLGNAWGTALYSIDDARNMVVFSSNTLGSTVAVAIHVFDLNEIAAEIWRKKASHYAVAYDFSTDNHSLKRSQLVAQCRETAAMFEAMSGGSTIYVERPDMPGDTGKY